ncbi:MAG: efflux RND transporter periplasmic adaptor subunit [Anaerolineae bacterium]|nr:efflux RND transporter periplasmic adaptor subunit [Anaerolineae bacterium]
MSRSTIIMVIGLVVVAGLGVVGYQRFQAAQAPATPPLETAEVQRGDLVASVSATGSVEPQTTLQLTFKTAGRLAEVRVRQGDTVKQGDALARLETGELELGVAQARATLAQARANLAKAQVGASAQDRAAAEAAVRSAQAGLAQLKVGPTQADLAQSQAGVRAAQAQLDKLRAGPRAEDVETARLNIEQAKNNLWGMQANRDSVCGRASDKNPAVPKAECDRAQAQVQAGEQAVQIAQQTFEKVQAGPTPQDLAAAQAEVDRAQAALAKLREGVSRERLAQAEAEVDRAQAQLDKLQAGPTNEDVAALQAGVDQAQASLSQAELRLRDAALAAPADGTLASVNGKAGELVTAATPIMTLADLSHLQVSLTIDETEISRVQVGQTARVTLDAHPGQDLEGKVAEIAPTATVQQGVVTYRVKVELPATDLLLKPGMTANVEIILDRRQGVLLVPNRAIRTANGQRVVQVVRGTPPAPVDVPVRLGLSNDQVTEVVSGLSEGDRVVTQVTPTNNPLSGGFGGR